MVQFPVFLSVVVVLRNQAALLESLLLHATTAIADRVSDYELIVVDNASDDDSIKVLKRLAGEGGLPNLQVYALTKEVDMDTAAWVGMENALGDLVAMIDPLTDDITFLPTMLDKAVSGADVVFASNEQQPRQTLAYRVSSRLFHLLWRRFTGVNLAKDAPKYRILSKHVVNFILRHPQPVVSYRHLPATGGFSRVNLSYSAQPRWSPMKRLADSTDRGMRLLVSTTRAPMRAVTALSLFGAISNLLYSTYVIGIAIFKEDVAPGWVTLSLQQSGMFFLITLVLLVLGEYILHMASLSNEGPLYHVAQEFTSIRVKRRERLNVEEAATPLHPQAKRQ